MKIGLCGAQGVGKSTLLDELKKQPRFESFHFCEEITRKLAKDGFKINKEGDDATQLAIVKEHICNLSLWPNMITDRTILDGYVYTKYLYDNAKVSRDTYRYAAFALQMLKRNYDLIFYLPPEFDIVEDEVRTADIQFRDDIVWLFSDTILVDNISTIPLRGTVSQRVDMVMTEVEEYVWKKA